MNRAWDQSQADGLVWEGMITDLRIFGRGWSIVELLPRLWADDDYKRMVADYLELLDRLSAAELGSSRMHDLKQAAAETLNDLEDYTATNFPIRWRYCDARGTWPLLSHERHLPEVVEVYEATAAEIAADYGLESVPGNVDQLDTTKIKLYLYSNWYWTAVAVSASAKGWFGREHVNSRLAREPWKHGLKRSPYVLMEAFRLNTASEGIAWKSAGRDYKDMIETYDEMLSEARNIIRRNAEMGLMAQQTVEQEISSEVKQQIELNLGPGIDSLLPYGIEVAPKPVPLLHPELLDILGRVEDFIQQIALNPNIAGVMKSGQSAAGYIAARQATIKSSLGEYEKAVTKAAEDVGQLLFSYVPIFNREFPDSPDKIYVVSKDAGPVAVRPKDVKGWGVLIQARVPSFLPIDQNMLMNLMAKAQDIPGLDPYFILAQYGNIENPDQRISQWKRWKIEEALLTQREIPQALALAQALEAQMPQASAAELAQEIAALPPAAQEVVLQQRGLGAQPSPGPGTQPGSPGALRQGMSNEARAGIPPAGISELQFPVEAPIAGA